MSKEFWKWRPGGSATPAPSGPAPPQPPPLPAASAEYLSTLSSTQPGAPPQQFPWKLSRSSDGKVRMDHGDRSVITDPVEHQAITLDHVKKEALAIAIPQAGQGSPPVMPSAGQKPAMPDPPNVKDLGKKLLQGHEADGKLFTFQPPAGPQPPPGGAAQKPHTVEVWTSKELGLPLLTQSSGPHGEQKDECTKALKGEPPAEAFQIPPGYKMVKLPESPKPPGAGT